MGSFGGILEEQNATENADREGQAPESSDRSENFLLEIKLEIVVLQYSSELVYILFLPWYFVWGWI